MEDQFGKDLGEKASKSDMHWGIGGEKVPAYVLDVIPGDVLVFNHNTFHSAWNGSTHRRMFTMNLCECYKDHEFSDLLDYIAGASRFWIDRYYSEVMMNTASPERMKHLEQVMANDGHLAASSAQMRLMMSEPSRG